MTNNKFSKKQKVFAFFVSVLALSFLANYFVFAWTEPPYGGVCTTPPCPPGGNVPTPINVSLFDQYKEGKLQIGGTSSPFNTLEIGNFNLGMPILGSPLGTLVTTGGAIINMGDGAAASNPGLLVPYGNVGIGTTSPKSALHVGQGGVIIGDIGSFPPSIFDTGEVPNALIMSGYNRDVALISMGPDDTGKADIDFFRAKGSPSAPSDVLSTTELGWLQWHGYYGGSFTDRIASMGVMMDGTPGTDDYPTRFEFQTTPDGSNLRQTRMVIKNDGAVGIGTTSPGANLAPPPMAGGEVKLEVAGHIFIRENGEPAFVDETASDNPILNPLFEGRRSRGAIGAPLPVQAGDSLWEGWGMGWDGSSFDVAGQILMEVDGPVAANSVPGSILFGTTPIGSNGVVTRMVIKNDGNVGIGTQTPGQKLEVNGGIKLNTTDVKPACDATTRGTLWFTQGAAGVKDDMEVCAKDAADVYMWRILY